MKNHIEILEILRDLHKVSGFRVSIHDTDCHEIYAYPAAGSSFCSAIQRDPSVLASCKLCDKEMLQKVRDSGETLLYRCKQGLYEAAAPIYHYGVLSGFLMIGQVRDTSAEDLKTICTHATSILGDEKLATKLACDIPAMEESTVRAFLSITTVIAEYLTATNRVQTDGGKLAELIARYIRKNYAQQITLEILAQQFGYCNATMTKNFRKEYGTTIFAFLREVRLEAAAKLLQRSNKPIKEVASSCGIQDQNYFSRVFTEQYGCSPSMYRNATK